MFLKTWIPAFAGMTDSELVQRFLKIRIALSIAIFLSPSAWAFDPLLVAPDALETGVTLPGDSAPPLCPAQKDFASPLTLGEAVDLALCNNPQIQAAWANIKIQAAALGEARAAYLPTLSASASRINDETRYPGTEIAPSTINRNTANASLNWRLLDFGGRSASHQSAEDLLAAALASHDATLQKNLAAVIQAYFDALTARAFAIAKVESEEIAGNTLASAKRREAKGAIAQSDTLQATTAHARAVLEKSRAESAYQKALSVLTYAIGVPGATRITLPLDMDEKAGEKVDDLNRWLEDAQNKHPAIIAARAQLDAARNKVVSTSSEGLPTLDFSGNYYQNGRPGQSLTPARIHETTLGVVLTIPIFDGFSRTYKVQGAQAQVEQREAELADTEHQILMEVVKAHADALAALKNIRASEDLLQAAQNAQAVSQRKYDKRAADILEVLNTQSALSDARQERIRCLAEWRSARLRLLANAGQMGRAAADK
jgi:outer membrane protein